LILEQFSRFVQQYPTRAEWPFRRGKLYLEKLHSYEIALQDLNDAIRIGPVSADYYEARGDAFLKLRKADEAIADFQVAIEEASASDKKVGPAPSRVLAERHRKCMLAHILKVNSVQQDIKEVERHRTAALALAVSLPDQGRIQEEFGLVYLRQGAFKQSLDHSGFTLKTFGPSPWLHLTRYIAAPESGATEEAKTALKDWQGLHVANNLTDLYDFIPALLQKHLRIKKLAEYVLRPVPGATADRIQREHLMELVAGKQYVIDMESTVFDAYLIARDPAGKEFARDDDGGGGLNARLLFTPDRSGTYTIVATSFERNAQGAYTLIIREAPAPAAP
jgi:hypothetical protein